MLYLEGKCMSSINESFTNKNITFGSFVNDSLDICLQRDVFHLLLHFLQVLAGYDNGLDPRQPSILPCHEYSKEVGTFLLSSCTFTLNLKLVSLTRNQILCFTPRVNSSRNVILCYSNWLRLKGTYYIIIRNKQSYERKSSPQSTEIACECPHIWAYKGAPYLTLLN